MKTHASISRHHEGFTLIEILIAVIVLAIGLLGVAGLQTVSMQQTAAADARSVAVMHTQTMAERIRSLRGLPSQAEINDWVAELKSDLGGDSIGEVEGVGTNRAVISVQWVERMNRLDPGGQSDSGEGTGGSEQVVSNFSLNVRYRE